MSLSLGLAVLVSVQAAAPGETWVVLTRRSGVVAPRALEVAKAVSSQLTASGIPSTLAVEDLTKCNGKKPCLVELGRKKKVPAMVFVEVGTVLDEAFARAEAVSVEEDGKRLGVAEVEGVLEALGESIKARTTISLVPPLRGLLGVAAPAPIVKETAAVAKPEPVVEAPPPLPEPEPVVVTKPAEPEGKPFFTGGRIAGLIIAGAGVGTLIASGVFGGSAAGGAGEQARLCPAGQQCSNPAAFKAYNDAAAAQNTSVVLLGVGVGLAAAGVVVMLLPTGTDSPSAAVTMVPVQGGMAASLSGSF